jgi:hypothetical protein
MPNKALQPTLDHSMFDFLGVLGVPSTCSGQALAANLILG